MSSTLTTLLEEKVIVHTEQDQLYHGDLSDFDDDSVRLDNVKRLLPEMDKRGEPKVNSKYLTNVRKSYDFVIPVKNLSELRIGEIVISRTNIKFIGRVSNLTKKNKVSGKESSKQSD